jgi:hypothetical protein
MENNRSKSKGPTLPVETVSWHDAKEFCRRLSMKEGKEYTLPTEAEWEYACRSGTTGPFSTGKNLTTGQANYNGNPYPGYPKGIYRGATVSVGSFAPNGFGLHDMHGNVWEWCEDWSADYQSSFVQDPKGPATGSERVVRGGGLDDEARGCRSAIRGWLPPETRTYGAGFRVVMRAGPVITPPGTLAKETARSPEKKIQLCSRSNRSGTTEDRATEDSATISTERTFQSQGFSVYGFGKADSWGKGASAGWKNRSFFV